MLWRKLNSCRPGIFKEVVANGVIPGVSVSDCRRSPVIASEFQKRMIWHCSHKAQKPFFFQRCTTFNARRYVPPLTLVVYQPRTLHSWTHTSPHHHCWFSSTGPVRHRHCCKGGASSRVCPAQRYIRLSCKQLFLIDAFQPTDGEKTVQVYEHLVGDATGCVIVKSQQGMKCAFKSNSLGWLCM